MEQRLARAHEDKRASEVECDSLRWDKERLTAKVDTLEQEVRRANGGSAPAPTAEGEAESLTAERVVGGWEGDPTPPAPGSSWPGRRRSMQRPRRRTDRFPPSPQACTWHSHRPRWRWRLGRSLPICAGMSRPMSSSWSPPHPPTASRGSVPPPPPPPHGGSVGRQLQGGGAKLLGLRRAEFCRGGG